MNQVSNYYVPGITNYYAAPSETISVEPYTREDANQSMVRHLVGLQYELENAKRQAMVALPAENRKWWALYRDRVKTSLRCQLRIFVKPPCTMPQGGFGDEQTKVTELNEVNKAA